MIKYVKIMPEIMANPIWDFNGVMMSWKTFNCPDDHLANALVIWNNDYNCYDSLVGDDSVRIRLYERGLKLARYVKHYYPKTTVLYQLDDSAIEITEGESMWRKVDKNVR